MTKAYYLHVFGSRSAPEKAIKKLLIDRDFAGLEIMQDPDQHIQKQLVLMDFESGSESNLSSDESYSGYRSYMFQREYEILKAVRIPYSQITNEYYAWVKTSVYILPDAAARGELRITVNFEHNGYPYKQKIFKTDIVSLRENEWSQLSFEYLTPEVRNTTDQLLVDITYEGIGKVYMDDLKIDVYEPLK